MIRDRIRMNPDITISIVYSLSGTTERVVLRLSDVTETCHFCTFPNPLPRWPSKWRSHLRRPGLPQCTPIYPRSGSSQTLTTRPKPELPTIHPDTPAQRAGTAPHTPTITDDNNKTSPPTELQRVQSPRDARWLE